MADYGGLTLEVNQLTEKGAGYHFGLIGINVSGPFCPCYKSV
jgi:hypothetical protein